VRSNICPLNGSGNVAEEQVSFNIIVAAFDSYLVMA
jgi:hypothetical protein